MSYIDADPPSEIIKHELSILGKAANRIVSASKQVEDRIFILEEKEKAWAKLEATMTINAQKAKEKIRLDIGGKTFTTTKSTLLQIKDTYFYAMLASGKWQPDEDGEYFIDRDPKYFDRILEYLRSGKFSWGGLDSTAKQKLLKDLDYYQISLPDKVEPDNKDSELPQELAWSPGWCGPMIRYGYGSTNEKPFLFEENNKRATCLASGSVIGNKAVTQFRVKIITSMTGGMWIGLACQTGYTFESTSHGYYLGVRDTKFKGYFEPDIKTAINKKISNGDVVEVKYNPANYQISFSVNDVSFGVAFSKVPKAYLFPAVILEEPGTSVILLS